MEFDLNDDLGFEQSDSNETCINFGKDVDECDNISEDDIVGFDDEDSLPVGRNDMISAGDTGLNIQHSGTIVSHSVSCDNQSEAGNNVDSVCKKLEERFVVGSNMLDREQAYLLYCEYGRLRGFGVRRGEQRYFGRTEELKWKEFLCCSAGLPDCKGSKLPSDKSLSKRTGCKAKLRIRRKKSDNESWQVSIFENSHNHGLLLTDQACLLRSSRNLSYANQSVLQALRSAGIEVGGSSVFMEQECGMRQDAYDHLKHKERQSKLGNDDATALMEHMINKSNEEPFLYWRCQLDDDGRLMNFFFRDSRCADDYRAFGDVLLVDTTFPTKIHKLICAPFVGINHHRLTVSFGVAFLSDETTTTFEWLLSVFLASMNGVQPKTVFTDQSEAMMKAIRTTFPHSKHRLCEWRINKNASFKFGMLNLNSECKKMWHRCMNEIENEKEFDEIWKVMLQSIQLRDKPWFTTMYKLRHMWASVFTGEIFSPGLLASSLSEDLNRALKTLERSSNTISEFVSSYDLIQNQWRHKEAKEDIHGNPVSDNPLFTQAASIYTQKVYKLFEREGIESLSVVVTNDRRDLGDGIEEATATSVHGGRSCKVIFNKYTNYATCSCRKWESEGIFCRHILKVYSLNNVFAIPECQILKRWTKRAKDECYIERIGTGMPQLYEMACSLDNEEARSTIVDCLESIRVDVSSLVGMPKAKPKRKALIDLNANDNDGVGREFRDPNLEAFKTKGVSKMREGNLEASTSMPRVAREFVVRATAPRTLNSEEIPDPIDGIFQKYSQF